MFGIVVDETSLVLLCTAIAGTLLLSSRQVNQDVPYSRIISQSLVSKTRKKGESAPFRSRYAVGSLRHSYLDGLKIPINCLQRGISKAKQDSVCIKWRNDDKSGTMTYSELAKRVENFGSGLKQLGLPTKSFVLISLPNVPEGIVNDLGCQGFGFIPVIISNSFDTQIIARVINENQISAACVSADAAETLLLTCPNLKHIIISCNESKLSNEKILKQSEVESLGEKNPSKTQTESKPDDLATIVFTSGTTGFPKGVAHSSRSIIAMMSSIMLNFTKLNEPNESDVYLSHLPHSLICEKLALLMMLSTGGTIALYKGHTKSMFQFINEVKPTIFPASPDFWNKIDKSLSRFIAQSSAKKYIFEMALKKKKEYLKEGSIKGYTMWDSMVFEPVKGILGGKVKIMLTYCGPTNPTVAENLRCCFGCNLIEIYDLSEGGAITQTIPGDYSSGHSGSPSACNELKLVDVEEMGATAEDKPSPRGEICYRGHNLFLGYLKGGEVLKEGIDEDGYFHTGDIGELNPTGTITVIDRKENFVKIEEGKWVALEFLERIYSEAILVSQICLNLQEKNLHAIVVPNTEDLLDWAQLHGIKGDISSLCEEKSVYDAIISSMKSVAALHNLKDYEIVSNIRIEVSSFAEKNMLSVCKRLRRPLLIKK